MWLFLTREGRILNETRRTIPITRGEALACEATLQIFEPFLFIFPHFHLNLDVEASLRRGGGEMPVRPRALRGLVLLPSPKPVISSGPVKHSEAPISK